MSHTSVTRDPQTLPNAELDWCDGYPVARHYGDIYASNHDPLAEKSHVFLKANQIQQRIDQLKDKESLHVLELGFGTGANFLLTWQLWQQQMSSATKHDAHLIYVSIENRPIKRQDLIYCHQQWPALQPLSQQLQKQYPIPLKGWHSLTFGEVTLVLILADVDEATEHIKGYFDAVYLDGFSPDKNPAMWEVSILQKIANCCHDKTTLSTYSAARMVKDNLHKAGFQFELLTGFGRKRNLLKARLKPHLGGADNLFNKHHSHSHYKDNYKPIPTKQNGYQFPWRNTPPAHIKEHGATIAQTKVAVIGAGIAGCTTALALQKRGYQVQLIEQGDNVAQGASGNRLATLYVNVTKQANLVDAFFQQALSFTLQQLHTIEQQDIWSPCGLLQMAGNQAEMGYYQQVCQRGFPETWLTQVSAKQASQLAGCNLPYGGLWLPRLGWVKLDKLCAYWSDKLHFNPWFKQKAVALNQVDGAWLLTMQSNQAGECVSHTEAFDIVVICNAYSAEHLLPNSYLPMRVIRGQVSYLKQGVAPQVLLCGDGYITPSVGDIMAVGASYNLHNSNLDIDAADHTYNISKLDKASLNVPQNLRAAYDEWVGLRAVTRDRLPMVGALAHADEVKKRFAHLRKDKHYLFNQPVPWLKGLYVNIGHGSKGLVSAPISAQLLTAQIAGDVWSLPMNLGHALNPNRFLFRDIIRNQL